MLLALAVERFLRHLLSSECRNLGLKRMVISEKNGCPCYQDRLFQEMQWCEKLHVPVEALGVSQVFRFLDFEVEKTHTCLFLRSHGK